jgi:hypothetical protein
MKKIKMLWLLPAIALVVFLSAFSNKTATPQNSFNGDQWFEYIGDANGNGPANPLNYTATLTSSCGTGVAVLCRIYVESDGEATPHPDADALGAMQTEISSAIGDEETDDVLLKSGT